MAENSTAGAAPARPSFWRFANPHEFMRLTDRILPWMGRRRSAR